MRESRMLLEKSNAGVYITRVCADRASARVLCAVSMRARIGFDETLQISEKIDSYFL